MDAHAHLLNNYVLFSHKEQWTEVGDYSSNIDVLHVAYYIVSVNPSGLRDSLSSFTYSQTKMTCNDNE